MGEITFITPELRRVEHAGGKLIGLFRFGELRPLVGVTGLVDWRLHGRLSRLVIDGFLDGGAEESLLVPLGGRLPQEHLLLLGLGPRDGFDRARFVTALERLFDAADKLLDGRLVLALPGRAEQLCEPAAATEWLLEIVGRRERERDMVLVEPAAAQKEMLPVLERWRLKQMVP